MIRKAEQQLGFFIGQEVVGKDASIAGEDKGILKLLWAIDAAEEAAKTRNTRMNLGI